MKSKCFDHFQRDHGLPLDIFHEWQIQKFAKKLHWSLYNIPSDIEALHHVGFYYVFEEQPYR